MKMNNDFIKESLFWDRDRLSNQISLHSENSLQSGPRINLVPELPVLVCECQQIARLSRARRLSDCDSGEHKSAYDPDRLEKLKPIVLNP